MLITIGSVTTASRLAKIIEREMKIRTFVMHTPSELNKGGCSYSVRVFFENPEDIRGLAEKYNIKIKHFYKETKTGRGRVYDALS